MTQLPDEHVSHLDNIVNGGLLKKVVPSHAEEYLLKQGYIKKGVGGLMPTQSGYNALKERLG